MSQFDVGRAFALAAAAYEAGRLGEAKATCRKILGLSRNFGGAHYLLGLIALREEQPRRAAEHLNKAVALSPEAPAPRMALARALAASGRLDAALQHYRRLPPSPEVCCEMAALLRRAGKIGEALDAYATAVALKPDAAEALNGLGALLTALGRPATAVAPLRRAVALQPGSPATLNNLGLALRDSGHAAAAVGVLEEALRLKPDAATAHANLAGALRQLGRTEAALEHARRAVALDDSDAEAWLALALAERAAGGDGRGALAKAVKRDDTLAPAHFLLGEAARAAGDAAEAARHYRRYLALDPADRHGAALQLALVSAAPLPERAPDDYVRTLFDQYAERFDAELVDRLHYQGPVLIAGAIAETLGQGPFDVLDIGCGTGLVGAALKPLARRLDGLDLSPRMVEKAVERGLYDDVAVADLVVAMQERPETYDLVVAGDVFVYLGDLAPAFAAAATTLRPDGALVFSVEQAASGIALGAHARYAHGRDYLEATAASAGFTVARLNETATRHESGQPVPSWLAVLRKG